MMAEWLICRDREVVGSIPVGTGLFAGFWCEQLFPFVLLLISAILASHEKINNLGFRPGPTQTRLYSHRSRLEKEEELYYPCSENKSGDHQCSYYTADLRLCFAYADGWFFWCSGSFLISTASLDV